MQALAAIASVIVALWSRFGSIRTENKLVEQHKVAIPSIDKVKSDSDTSSKDSFHITILDENNVGPKHEVYCTTTACFDLEVADTESARTYGLMFRETMPELSGMIFVFDQPWVHKFWMKNTLMPLDMIRLDESGVVIDIEKADPCTQDPCEIYGLEKSSSYVVELKQGVADIYKIEIGSAMQWPRF